MPDLAMLDYFYGDEAEQFTFLPDTQSAVH